MNEKLNTNVDLTVWLLDYYYFLGGVGEETKR